jgi:hypothetical protein
MGSPFHQVLLRHLAAAAGLGTLLLPAACERDRETSSPPPQSCQPAGQHEQLHCGPPAPNDACPGIAQAAPVLGVPPNELRCGPVVAHPGANCCYVGLYRAPAPGRPFVVAGERVEARARRGIAREEHTALSAEERRILADHWTRDALGEHASIASFAHWALELCALGAPPELLRGAHEAALDEIRHAEQCFALASRHAGRQIEPEPLAIPSRLGIRGDLADFVRATVRDGCIGETASALIADAQLASATDPEVRRVLAGIRDDEARHAALAWRALAWALERGGAAVAEAARSVLVPPVSSGDRARASDRLRAHGYLSEPERAAVLAEAWRVVIEPIATRTLT